MGIGTGTAAIIGGLGAAGSIGGGLIAANAAGNAADTQANAATQAAQIQANSAAQALQFQRDQFNTTQNNIAPWLNVGRGALANTASLMGIPMDGMTIPGTGTPGTPSQTIYQGGGMADKNFARGAGGQYGFDDGTNGGMGQYQPREVTTIPGTPGTPATPMSSLVNPALGAPGSLAQGFGEKFQAPTGATEQNDPGYQFRLSEGMKALEHSAAAKGDLLSGGTAKAEQQFGQDYASNEYGNVYNRQMGEYLNRFNIFNANNTNTFNRLQALSGGGQTSATTLASAGQNAANNAGALLIDSGNAQASGINNAAAARASGYVGAGNAFAGALGGTTSNLSQLALLNSMYGDKSGWGMGQGGG